MGLDFLLEIGTEEIPASLVDLGMNQLKGIAKNLITGNRLTFTELKTMGTPRRLVLLVKDLSEKQDECTEEIKGPAVKVAFDEKGKPSQAALGFARSQKVDVSDLIVKESPQGSYVFVIKKHKRETAQKVLPEILKKLVLSLSFPKTMRWGDSEIRFVRPIHWFLALYGEEVIEFSLDGIKSSNLSRGHRFLVRNSVEIKNSEDYLKVMRDAKVIVDYEERRNLILNQINQAAKDNNGKAVLDEKTFDEVVNLVEYPYVACGRFTEEFLSLPREVLITSMESHQRYFPVEDEKGKLKANFIVVHNGDENCKDIIVSGHEKVLRARLSDARFFYQEDQKESFAGKTEKLKNVVFQEKLGSIFDKVKRIEKLAGLIADSLELGQTERENVLRAVFLCKTDLITNMVVEFPVLQGIMGREYAKLSGEKEEVSIAIYEHYLPRSAGDNLPETEIGQIISIADKIDTIVGCFCIGFIPSGSEDPYSLRRQTQGIIEIILKNKFLSSLSSLIDFSLNLLIENGIKFNRDKVKIELDNFLIQRTRQYFLAKGESYDVLDAVLIDKIDKLIDIKKKIEAVSVLKNSNRIEDLLTPFNRCKNLSKAKTGIEVDENILVETEEKDLFLKVFETEKLLDDSIDKMDYETALEVLTGLRSSIDLFFDKVLVMAEDEKVRSNRLALLNKIVSVYQKVADFSKIVVESPKPEVRSQKTEDRGNY